MNESVKIIKTSKRSEEIGEMAAVKEPGHYEKIIKEKGDKILELEKKIEAFSREVIDLKALLGLQQNGVASAQKQDHQVENPTSKQEEDKETSRLLSSLWGSAESESYDDRFAVMQKEIESMRAEFQGSKAEIIDLLKLYSQIIDQLTVKSAEVHSKDLSPVSKSQENIKFLEDLEKVSELMDIVSHRNKKKNEIREINFEIEDLAKKIKDSEEEIEEIRESLKSIPLEKEEKEKKLREIDVSQLLEEKKEIEENLKELQQRKESYKASGLCDGTIKFVLLVLMHIGVAEKRITKISDLIESKPNLAREIKELDANFKEKSTRQEKLIAELEQLTPKMETLLTRKTPLERYVENISAEIEARKNEIKDVDLSKFYGNSFMSFN